MMFIPERRYFLIITIAVLFAIIAVQAQVPQGPPTSQDEKATIFRSDTRLVVLHATVVDKNGRFVTGWI